MQEISLAEMQDIEGGMSTVGKVLVGFGLLAAAGCFVGAALLAIA